MDLPLYTTVSRNELSDLGSADYHLFNKAIVLDQVMRQAGVDTEPQLFRDLLLRLRGGQTTVEDWKNLMKQTPAVVGATTHHLLKLSTSLQLPQMLQNTTSTSYMPVASLLPCSKLSTMVQVHSRLHLKKLVD